MPTASAQRKAAKLDEDVERLVNEFDRELARVWVLLRRKIIALTAQLETEGGKVRSTAVNVGVARKVAQELEAALLEAGYDELVADATAAMGDLAKYQGVAQRVVASTQVSTAWSASVLEAFHAMKLNELLAVKEDVKQLEQVVLRAVLGESDRATLVTDLVDKLEIKLPQVRTIYDTAVSEFSRVVVASTAGDDLTQPFWYDGPIDALVRDWCMERVGKIFTRQAIDEMDNGQLDNVLITGGGYNCRHKFIPLDPEDEWATKANTNSYADPEFGQRVAQARATKEAIKANKREAAAVRREAKK